MNANAYGGDLVARARVGRGRHAGGHERRRPASSASPTAARTSGPREVVARASFALAARRARGGEGHARRACATQRKAAQPSGIKTFGSTFKNPDDPRAEGRARACCSTRPAAAASQVGGARFSEKHANFVENTGRGHHRRRGRADGRGPPPRARALRRELEPEVQFLGEVDASELSVRVSAAGAAAPAAARRRRRRWLAALGASRRASCGRRLAACAAAVLGCCGRLHASGCATRRSCACERVSVTRPEHARRRRACGRRSTAAARR